jgi:hypothetical protein
MIVLARSERESNSEKKQPKVFHDENIKKARPGPPERAVQQ